MVYNSVCLVCRHQKEKSLRRSLTSSASFRSSTSLEKMLDSPASENLAKKEKEAAQKAKDNEVKNLEFVKVDVDNNLVNTSNFAKMYFLKM